MGFSIQPVKGLSKVLVDTDIDPGALRLHISEIAPGTAAHPPHTHEGVEAFYVLEGHGTLETQGERYDLGPNEAILLDATKGHGLTNTGDVPMRYVVIIAGG
ncbi:MAG: cupin domain-containing protein [Anaerolineae bacterium]|nr:cupin domain-containing protein [Anaerolineae bacterium]